jgi:hypothetical protein
MNPSEAEKFFEAVRSDLPGTVSKIIHRGSAVALRLEADSRPDMWAELFVPGETWCTLSFNGGFQTGEVYEDATEAERRASLLRFVAISLAYLRGDYRIRKSAWLRQPVLEISTDSGVVEVDLTIDASFRKLFGR